MWEETSTHHFLTGWVLLLSPSTPLPPPLWRDECPRASSSSTHSSSAADCDSYCKPAKGNYKINMKKYCKKDYGKGL